MTIYKTRQEADDAFIAKATSYLCVLYLGGHRKSWRDNREPMKAELPFHTLEQARAAAPNIQRIYQTNKPVGIYAVFDKERRHIENYEGPTKPRVPTTSQQRG